MNTLYLVEILKSGLNLIVTLITLGLSWVIGQRLTVKWNLHQKQRETDIAILQQFYLLYGEFKEVGKIWRITKEKEENEYPTLEIPLENRWLLLSRACAVEGKNEAIMVKLATERHLDEKALRDLGLFRQAVQQLRESIRDDKKVPSFSRGPEYDFFNDLAAKVGFIISSSSTSASSKPKSARQWLIILANVRSPASTSVSSKSETASERLRILANVRSPDFEMEIDRFKQTHPEYNKKKPNNAHAHRPPRVDWL